MDDHRLSQYAERRGHMLPVGVERRLGAPTNPDGKRRSEQLRSEKTIRNDIHMDKSKDASI